MTLFAAIDSLRGEENFRDTRFAVARLGQPMPAEAPPLLHTEFSPIGRLSSVLADDAAGADRFE